jgi:hypothetical protein
MDIYTKLLEVQKEIGAIKKEETNPFFKSRYFDINGLLAAVKPVLNKHGLVLIQGLTHINGKLFLNTQIIDSESGKVLDGGNCPLPENSDAQKTGAIITYFRRYALQSLLALEAEDDDANSAKLNQTKPVEITEDNEPF